MNVLEDGPVICQATKRDARVTGIGRVLRQSSIDELPQLFNVLKGDMSLVGPRPHAVAHDEQYKESIANYAFRHHVKPGLTGLAQVNGCRGETKHLAQMQKRIDHDLWYIDNWSLLLDLHILVRTTLVPLKRDGY
jgi:lipopolysaccharide/colanic/teichoic acid biosynthesis glycosyltransferase